MTPRGSQLNRLNGRARALAFRLALACCALTLFPAAALADRLHLKNGAVIEVDEAWENADGVWYRRGAVTQLIAKDRVSRIEKSSGEKGSVEKLADVAKPVAPAEVVKRSDAAAPRPAQTPPARTVWIHLVGGAKIEVEEVDETSEGVWYKRASFSIFIDKERVARVERDAPTPAGAAGAPALAHRSFGWTTGSARLDELIRQNGARHGVDPYLIFCVMEHESHFRARAVSHAGARGLMQLMPGTARRFGVRDVFDPAQNVAGGTRYLKELLDLWGGRVDLALASYNAGEGAVMKYGKRVPPYRETRNYVRLIGARYGQSAAPTANAPVDTAP
jgi:soluble lytic murein transglycosylase-like protein